MILDRTFIPEWLARHWREEQFLVDVSGKSYACLVVEPTLPGPPCNCGFNPQRYVPPFVTSDVPDEFHSAIAMHLILRRLHYRNPVNGIARTIAEELKLFTRPNRKRYIAFRITMIQGWLDWADDPANDGIIDAEFFEEARAVLLFLQQKRQPVA